MDRAINVYLISSLINDKKIYKIGITKRDVNERIKDLKTGNPFDFEIEKVFVAEKYGNSVETRLHKTYKSKKINGEWFSLNENDVDSFINLCQTYHNIFESLQKSNTYLQDKGVRFS